MNKFKVMLIVMSLLVVGMCLISIGALYVNDVTIVINTTSGQPNLVEYSLTEMNNSLEAENITYSGTESYIRYLTVPKNSNVTSAILNITGLNVNGTNYTYQENATESSNFSSPVMDGNKTTGNGDGVAFQNIFMNYTKLNDRALWELTTALSEGNYTIPFSCWDYDATKIVLKVNMSDSSTFNFNCYNSTDWELILSDSDITVEVFEEAIYWDKFYDENADETQCTGNSCDGDWGTSESINGIGKYLNYTKLIGSSGAIWEVKDDVGSENLSIPSGCWNYDSTKLQLYYNQYAEGLSWWCNDGTWNELRGNIFTASLAYEEAITWNVTGGYPSNVTINIGNDGDVEFIAGGYTYQENATESTNFSSEAMDGNWSTAKYTHNNVFMNYTKPNNAGALWQVKGNSLTLRNVTIPSSCWGYNSVKLVLKANISDGADESFYCHNSTSWQIVSSQFSVAPALYEEAIWWDTVFNTTNQTADFSSEFNNHLKSPSYQENADETTCSGTNFCDGDWDTKESISTGSYYYMNYTKPANAINSSSWQLKHSASSLANFTIPANCWDYDSTKLIFRVGQAGIGDLWQCWDGTWNILQSGGSDQYEEAMWWKYCDEDSNGNCRIIMDIEATTGRIQIDTINITYDYNVSHAFDLNNSYTWNNTDSVVPNAKYKRRYSIQPTSDLLSNALNITGYYTRNGSPSLAEINNKPVTINANDYYEFLDNMSQGYPWNLTYIWDDNVSSSVGDIAINMTNTSTLVNDILYQNFSIYYKSADNVSAAPAGLFTNTTLSWNYNSTIGRDEKIEILISGTFYDITPSSTQGCPDYERQTASTRVFYTCLNRTEKYASIKIESNS